MEHVMNDNYLDIPDRYLDFQDAYEMGWSDFEGGLSRLPLCSPWLCENHPAGSPCWRSAFAAWLAGFDAANLAAPL